MRFARVCLLFFGLIIPSFVTACGSDDDEKSNGGSQKACTPGQSISCAGPAQCQGYQICNQTGTGYGACQCGSGQGGSSAVGSGGTSATGGSSSATGGATQGTGGAAQTGGTGATDCSPASAASFTPKYVPAKPFTKVCTPEEVKEYFDGKCNQQDCTDFMAGGAKEACGACLAPTDLSAPAYGPVLSTKFELITQFITNTAGCVELAGELECAKKMQASAECKHTVCAQTCAVETIAGLNEFNECQEEAATSSCKQYEDQTRCITKTKTSAACGGGTGDLFVQLGVAFCATDPK